MQTGLSHFSDDGEYESIIESGDISLEALADSVSTEFFIRDSNIYMRLWRSLVLLVDLKDALRSGRRTDIYTLNSDEDTPSLIEKLHEIGIDTPNRLFEAIREPMQLVNTEYKHQTQKSCRIYSPFVPIQPIKAPKKWDRAHIWRAILTGQIYRGVITQAPAYDVENPIWSEYVNTLKGAELSKDELLHHAQRCILPREDWDSVDVVSQNGTEEVIAHKSYHDFSYVLYFDEKRSETLQSL